MMVTRLNALIAKTVHDRLLVRDDRGPLSFKEMIIVPAGPFCKKFLEQF